VADDLDSALGFGVAVECVVYGVATHDYIVVGVHALGHDRQVVLEPM
jgi:hypothetical protein